MNIHFPQVERRSQLSSHILAAFAILVALMFVLSLVRHVEFHWSIPSVSVQTAQIENSDMPVAIPAPLPPVGQTQVIVTPEPAWKTTSVLVPQAIPAPAPSVP
jgi:hypothetical protein